jgi:hypothetical protein
MAGLCARHRHDLGSDASPDLPGPGIRQGHPVKVYRLVAQPWTMADRTGVAFWAARIEPGRATSVPFTQQRPQTRCKVHPVGIPAVCGDVMVARRQWSDLSERTRRLLTIAAVAEGILKLAALIDLKRRPASQIRGPKWLWATVLAIVSSAGVVPISYFVFGRRQPRT